MALIGEACLGRKLGEWRRRADELLLCPLEPQLPHECSNRDARACAEGPGEVDGVHSYLPCELVQGRRQAELGAEPLLDGGEPLASPLPRKTAVWAGGLGEQFQGEPFERQEPELVRGTQLSEHASGKLLDATIAKVPHPFESHAGRLQLRLPLLADVERQHAHDGAVETRVMADPGRHEVNDASRTLVRLRGAVVYPPRATQGDRQARTLVLVRWSPGTCRIVEDRDENSSNIEARSTRGPELGG